MADEAAYLTIGKLVKKLSQDYPDITVSKLRFLENEGLISPNRTPSGYRLYSHNDVERIETILHLQKSRFLPLSVIKERLDGGEEPDSTDFDDSLVDTSHIDSDADRDKLHPIERIPELIGVQVSLVRQLSDAGIIELKRSPHGRDMVEGSDFALILTCDELRRYGFAPKNLRQYVTASNRESALFEQALIPYAKKGGGVENSPTDETRQNFNRALSSMLSLTSSLREQLIKRILARSFKDWQK